jgi:DNA modification methylase
VDAMTVTLYHGDCLPFLRSLGDKSVDLIAADPQYGIGADKVRAHSSIRDNPDWENFGWDTQRPSKEYFDECLRVAKYCAFWGGNYFADLLPPSSAWLIWRKPEAETGFSLADAELCWTNGDFSARMLTSNRRDGNDHPTQKTVSIMNWTIEKFKLPKGAKVLDPFMGSGTTGVSCLHLGYEFIGCELIGKYFDIASRRIEAAQQQMVMPL